MKNMPGGHGGVARGVFILFLWVYVYRYIQKKKKRKKKMKKFLVWSCCAE